MYLYEVFINITQMNTHALQKHYC